MIFSYKKGGIVNNSVSINNRGFQKHQHSPAFVMVIPISKQSAPHRLFTITSLANIQKCFIVLLKEYLQNSGDGLPQFRVKR